MLKKISEIYTEYKIQPSLQEHMLRVAAVGFLICDNFSEPLPRDEIITACLLHDMGNILKFNLGTFPEFNKPEGIEYWQKVKDEYEEKYGKDEHKATIKILKELGLSEGIISIVDQVNFLFYCKLRDVNNMAVKIVIYADSRVGPHGVVSYDERMEEGKKRYQNRKAIFTEEERKKWVACGKEIEGQIFAKCKIKPEDISDETVASIIPKLRNFVIK